MSDKDTNMPRFQLVGFKDVFNETNVREIDGCDELEILETDNDGHETRISMRVDEYLKDGSMKDGDRVLRAAQNEYGAGIDFSRTMRGKFYRA